MILGVLDIYQLYTFCVHTPFGTVVKLKKVDSLGNPPYRPRFSRNVAVRVVAVRLASRQRRSARQSKIENIQTQKDERQANLLC